MLFAGLVEDGTVASLDDKVSKYLKWWTKNPFDNRSHVTFRMLLAFTSGFGDGHPGEEANTRAARQWRLEHNVSRRGHGLVERLGHQVGDEDGANRACNQFLGDITNCAKWIY